MPMEREGAPVYSPDDAARLGIDPALSAHLRAMNDAEMGKLLRGRAVRREGASLVFAAAASVTLPAAVLAGHAPPRAPSRSLLRLTLKRRPRRMGRRQRRIRRLLPPPLQASARALRLQRPPRAPALSPAPAPATKAEGKSPTVLAESGAPEVSFPHRKPWPTMLIVASLAEPVPPAPAKPAAPLLRPFHVRGGAGTRARSHSSRPCSRART